MGRALIYGKAAVFSTLQSNLDFVDDKNVCAGIFTLHYTPKPLKSTCENGTDVSCTVNDVYGWFWVKY